MPVRDLLKKPVISSLSRGVSILSTTCNQKSILADDQGVLVSEPSKRAIGLTRRMEVIVLLCVRNTKTSFCAEFPFPQNKLIVIKVFERTDL